MGMSDYHDTDLRLPFFFDGNQWFGLVDSRDQWDQLLRHYTLHEVLNALSSGVRGRALPSFGFRVEHTEPPTLEEWLTSAPSDEDQPPLPHG